MATIFIDPLAMILSSSMRVAARGASRRTCVARPKSPREAVVDRRRPALAVPMDVRGFEAEQRAAEQRVEAGDGAAMVVGGEPFVAEGGTARAALDQLGARGRLERWRLGHEVVSRPEIPHGGEVLQTDGLSQVGVQGRFKMLVEQQLDGLLCQARIGGEGGRIGLGDLS